MRLRQGLQLIDYPSERIGVLFDQLIALHESALEGSKPKQAANEDAVNVLPSEDLWMGEQEASEAGYLASDSIMPEPEALPQQVTAVSSLSLGELPVGAWVELYLDHAWLRAQLSWASPHRTLFMFVSRGGAAHSMSRRTMERLRVRGLIRIVSDGHAVENALDAVAQVALRNTVDKKN